MKKYKYFLNFIWWCIKHPFQASVAITLTYTDWLENKIDNSRK